VCSISNATILIEGDINFPGCDWINNVNKSNTSNIQLHHKLKDIFDNNKFGQIVQEEIRKNNILDLLITNSPSLIQRTDTLPSMSDHDIVFAALDVRPTLFRQKTKGIPIYSRAHWPSFKEELSTFKFISTPSKMYSSNVHTANDITQK